MFTLAQEVLLAGKTVWATEQVFDLRLTELQVPLTSEVDLNRFLVLLLLNAHTQCSQRLGASVPSLATIILNQMAACYKTSNKIRCNDSR